MTPEQRLAAAHTLRVWRRDAEQATICCYYCAHIVPQRTAVELPHLSDAWYDYFCCADCAAALEDACEFVLEETQS